LHQRNTKRLLQERHTVAYNTAIKLATNKRKLAFKTFLSQIYDLDLFKKHYKTTAYNNKLKHLFHCKTSTQKESTKYYHPLVNAADDVLEFASLPIFKMTQLTKLKKHQNKDHDSDMDEDKLIDKLLTEVDNEKREMKKSGTTGLQKKYILLTKLQSNNEITM
jgi:hypothetical protein